MSSPSDPDPSRAVVASVVTRLGCAQTLAWASSYYLPAMLAAPMAAGLGIGQGWVFAAFSAALLLSALVGPWAGRAIDHRGGRQVLMGSNLVFAAGLAGLGLAQGPLAMLGGWLLIGLAMGGGLYDSAFATLVRWRGQAARGPITGVTLFAGFASTLGWPLSAWMAHEFGWRGACFGWAAMHLLIGLPLNAWLPQAAPSHSNHHIGGAEPSPSDLSGQATAPNTDLKRNTKPSSVAPFAHSPPVALSSAAEAKLASAASGGVASNGTAASAAPLATAVPASPVSTAPQASQGDAYLLAAVFAATWFTSTAMATHLPSLLQASGLALPAALAVAALVGPAQVAARLLEFGLLRRWHPLLSAKLACLAHPLGAALLVGVGGPAGLAFAALHGAGNGVMTIAKGTLPLALFGSAGYGLRQAWIMAPSKVAQAFAPVLFGLLVQAVGSAALWLTAALGLASWWALRRLGRG